MKQLFPKLAMAAAFATASFGAALAADAAKPVVRPDGVVEVPAFELPPSGLASPEAQQGMKMRGRMSAQMQSFPQAPTIADARAIMEKQLAPMVQLMDARYSVDVVEQKIAGVRTQVFTPKGRKVDPKRVLINLHGGGFQMCAEGCARLESIPMAVIGGFKVISVDYREGPEALFPAASQDVAAVYKALLKTYKPKQIGIYGCSAGGSLSAAAAAWLPAHGLPQAGAIGVFGAGGTRFGTGDSAYIAGYLDGTFPPPERPGAPMKMGPFRSYFQGADMDDPMISPAGHPDVLAKFPPTLIITATRAPAWIPT